jgi:hypothetical protein
MSIPNFDYVVVTYSSGTAEKFFSVVPKDAIATSAVHPRVPVVTVAFHCADDNYVTYWVIDDWCKLFHVTECEVKSVQVFTNAMSFMVVPIANESVPDELFHYMINQPYAVIGGSFATCAAMKHLKMNAGSMSVGDIDLYALIDVDEPEINAKIPGYPARSSGDDSYVVMSGNWNCQVQNRHLPNGGNATFPCSQLQLITWFGQHESRNHRWFEKHVADIIDFTVASSTIRAENGRLLLTIRNVEDLRSKTLNLTSDGIITSVERCDKWKSKGFAPSAKTTVFLTNNMHKNTDFQQLLMGFKTNANIALTSNVSSHSIFSCQNVIFVMVQNNDSTRKFKIENSAITIIFCEGVECNDCVFECENSCVKFIGGNMKNICSCSQTEGTAVACKYVYPTN